MLWSGNQNADLYQLLNLKLELVSALPVFSPAYIGRPIFVTTPGPAFGLWLGGVLSWERAPTGGGGGSSMAMEPKTIVSQNIIPPLLYTPSSNAEVMMWWEGILQRNGVDFIASGTVITWQSIAAGFDIDPGESVYLMYKVA